MISSRAIRKGITIKFDGHIVDKKAVIEASKTWEPKHETLFMKLLKQGGKFTVNGVVVEVFPQENGLLIQLELTIVPTTDAQRLSVFFDQTQRVATYV